MHPQAGRIERAPFHAMTNSAPFMEHRRVPRRIGGEMPAFSDRLGATQAWQPNWLPFSHGRAALAWLLERWGIRSATVCAYTCPSVPTFLQRRGLPLGLFDVGTSLDEIMKLARAFPTPRMIILPALFGVEPWIASDRLTVPLNADEFIVIDAAQTAFGHIDFPLPGRGAILSCPRKTTALADGAVLAVPDELGSIADIRDLPIARTAASLKAAARALWATNDSKFEQLALDFNRASEGSWPDTPHRMNDESQVIFERLDRQWHADIRRRNRNTLAKAIRGRITIWSPDDGTPFSLPVFVGNRDAVLLHLREQRIFATALWPDASHDPARYPVAAWFARHLISLPVDQRHTPMDMERVAETILAVAERPSTGLPQQAECFVG